MQAYYDAIKQKEHDNAVSSAAKTALSSGVWGVPYGAASSLLSGQRSIPKILAAGLGSGLTTGSIGGGASLLGEELFGPANPNDPSAYAKQAGAGGVLGGGGLGAGTGYLLGTGKLAGLSHVPGAETIAKAAKASLPLDNLMVDWIKRKMMKPSHGSGLALAAGLGLLGGGLGGILGTEAGMDRDVASHLEDEENARELASRNAIGP